uniref:Uncharacterized protein n=1 Tax=Arundo donax TaxID=35708 RepID=A0A0A9H2P8_ARUDO
MGKARAERGKLRRTREGRFLFFSSSISIPLHRSFSYRQSPHDMGRRDPNTQLQGPRPTDLILTRCTRTFPAFPFPRYASPGSCARG